MRHRLNTLFILFLLLFSTRQAAAQWGYGYVDGPPAEPGLIGTSAVLDGVCSYVIVSSLTFNAIKARQPNTLGVYGTDANGKTITYDESNTHYVFPPRVTLGLTSIVYGSVITAVYKGLPAPLEVRTYRMGISNIALGAAVITIPPLLNLLLMGGNTKKKKKSLDMDVDLYMPRAYGTGGSVFGLSFYKTF